MTPGWLAAAMEQAFGDQAPACLVCGDEQQLRLVPVGTSLQAGVVPCPFHRPAVFTAVRWRRDVPRTGGDAA